jgi:hypothetical protein
MGEIIERVPPEQLINIDEPQLKLIAGEFFNWVRKGGESVRCHIQNVPTCESMASDW